MVKNCNVGHNVRMSKWMTVLAGLIKESGITKNSLHEKKVIDRNALNYMLREYESPTVTSLDKYLRAFGLTWEDWARAIRQYEEGKEVHLVHKRKPPPKRVRQKKAIVNQGA